MTKRSKSSREDVVLPFTVGGAALQASQRDIVAAAVRAFVRRQSRAVTKGNATPESFRLTSGDLKHSIDNAKGIRGQVPPAKSLSCLLVRSGVFEDCSGLLRLRPQTTDSCPPSKPKSATRKRRRPRSLCGPDSAAVAAAGDGAGGEGTAPPRAAIPGGERKRAAVALGAQVLLRCFHQQGSMHPHPGTRFSLPVLVLEAKVRETAALEGLTFPANANLIQWMYTSRVFKQCRDKAGSKSVVLTTPLANLCSSGGPPIDLYSFQPDEARRLLLQGSPLAGTEPAPGHAVGDMGACGAGKQSALNRQTCGKGPCANDLPAATPLVSSMEPMGQSTLEGPSPPQAPALDSRAGSPSAACGSTALYPTGAALQLHIGVDGRARVSPQLLKLPHSATSLPAAVPTAFQPCSRSKATGSSPRQAEASADIGDDTGDLLQILPGRLRRRVTAVLSASPSAGRPRTLVDMAVDAGRDVTLAFSDETTARISGDKVSMAKCLAALERYLLRRQEKSCCDDGGRDDGKSKCPFGEGDWRRVEDGDEPPRKLRRKASGGNPREPEQLEVVVSGPAAPSSGSPTSAPPGGPVLPPSHLFSSDNRCCPPGTLHRISALLDPRDGSVYGLTYRVGRHLPGVAAPLRDLLTDLAGRSRGAGAAERGGCGGGLELAGSLLLLGRPGSGKTTLLRDISRLLADDLGLRVVVVDTSNEIAGGDVLPHSCIGGARRAMVGPRGRLHRVMLEMVQNHGPQVVVVDEISNKEEVAAARTISQRGVMLVATAHGTTLASLMRNSELNPLVGGLEAVTLSDEEARRTNRGAKTRVERRGEPTFRTLIEVLGGGRMRIRPDIAASVDDLLGCSPDQRGLAGLDQGGTGGGGSGYGSQRCAFGRSYGGGCHPVGPQPPEPPRQQPGSLLGAGTLLPPLEQLRWTVREPSGGGTGAAGPGGQRVMVRLLQPRQATPQEQED